MNGKISSNGVAGQRGKKNQNFRKFYARSVMPVHLGHSPSWTDNVEIFNESAQQKYDRLRVLGKKSRSTCEQLA